jgi:hypothetical protein
MNKSLALFALSLSFLSFQHTALAEDDYMGSSSLSAEFNVDMGRGEPLKWGMGDGTRGPIQFKVKIHDDGEVDLDTIQWNSFVIVKNIESIGTRVDARVLGFYREELHQTIGAEVGMELLDFKINKVFKVEEDDNVSYIVNAYVTVDQPWFVHTNDDNNFVNQNIESGYDLDSLTSDEISGEDGLRHFRSGNYYISHGAEAKIRYRTQNGYMEAGAFYKDHSNRKFKNDEGDKYDYSKASRGVKVTIKPNRKKCHQYSVGFRQVEFNQSFNNSNNDMTDNQIFANYNCKFDLEKLIFGSSDDDDSDYNKVIRH